MDKKNLIEKSIEIFGDKYDFSLVGDIFTTKEKLRIICPEHGIFEKSYEKHIGNKQGCPVCSGKFRYTTETFIEKCKSLDDINELTFENVEYVNNKTKIKIYCHHKDENGVEHGEFEITPCHFLSGERCPKCRYIKSAAGKRRTLETVLSEVRKIHNNKYDYSLITEYKNDRIKLPIICPIHGVFEQNMNNHIKGRQGCPMCGRIKCDAKRLLTKDEFIHKAIKVHGDKYDYSKVDYKNNTTKVCIICPEHGEFWQAPANHLFNQGCPICKESKLEKTVRMLLSNNNIKYIREYSPEWLGRKRIDFYLPDYNIAIECQGKQHFLKEAGWGKNPESLELLQKRDKEKKKICEKYGIKMLYYSELNIEYPYEVITDKQKLLEKIKENNIFVNESNVSEN